MKDIHFKLFRLCAVAVALVFEILPIGAVLNFARAPESGGGTFKSIYSYFDLTPFGYANFGPFITATLTVALIALLIALLFAKKPNLTIATVALNYITAVVSFTPLLYGLNYFTPFSWAISILLSVSALSFFAEKLLTKND